MSDAAESTEAAKKRGTPGATKLIVAVAIVIGLGAIYYLMPGESETVSQGTTFVVKRGPLEILVMEGGDVVAQQKQEIKSRVEGMTTILYLEEEGTRITKEDVEAGKLLVELDSSQLQDRLDSESINFQTTESNYLENQQQLELQISTNEANIRAQQLTLRFALMDLQKFLGEGPANEILVHLGLDKKHEEIDQMIHSASTASLSGTIVTGGILESDKSGGRIGDLATDAQLLKGDSAAPQRGGEGGARRGGRSGQRGPGARRGACRSGAKRRPRSDYPDHRPLHTRHSFPGTRG